MRAILLTAPGTSAIAVVRLAGSGTGQFLLAHFSKPTAIGRCVHGDLRDGETVLDDAVVVRVAEDVADLNLHGGRWIVQSVLELAARGGFEIVSARADEPLPLDAVDGADLLEREMLASLPLARTERATRELLKQPGLWRARAFELLGESSAKAFMEGAAPAAPALQPSPGVLRTPPSPFQGEGLWRLLHPPTVAIVGAANVGKSTLANQLFAQERSITADVPGTTRDWVGDLADIDGLAVHLIDTPGLRPTADPIEAEAIRLAEGRFALADLLILVLDATRPNDPEQADLLRRFSSALVAMNKVDLATTWHASAMPLVASTGEGIDALRAAVARFFGIGPTEPAYPRWWTPRQRDLLLGMSEHRPSVTLSADANHCR